MTDGATDLLLDNGQAKWNIVKLGTPSPSCISHKVVLDAIRTDYAPTAPNSLVALRKAPVNANPYAQRFPHIRKAPPRHYYHPPISTSSSPSPEKSKPRQTHSPTTQANLLPPRPSTTPGTTSLPPATTAAPMTFHELEIIAPRSPKPRKHPTKAPLSLPKPSCSKSISNWNHTPLAAAPRFVPGLRSDDLKASRQLARQRQNLDATAHRLSKHERSGPTLASTLNDEQFNADMVTITTLAQDYATLGDTTTAWRYRGFGLRALGDRHMHLFVKNVTLQFYSDAVEDFTRACVQFEALAQWHVQSRVGRGDDVHHHILADDERLLLLRLDPTHVVQSFAAHAATTSLKHAYFAVSEAKTSHTGVSMHIRVACEMLSIAYTAFAWLDLDTVHLGFVHSSIDAAQHRANLRAALSHVALERHAALESEWARHRQDFNKQAESFLNICKQAESLRIAPKDSVSVLSTTVAASNVEKRAMAAVVQVMHSTGGNFVVRSHGKHVKDTEQVKKLSKKSNRRPVTPSQTATSSSRDVALITLLADKRSQAQKAIFDEDVVFACATAATTATARAYEAADRERQAWATTRVECDGMDEECMLSLAVEMKGERCTSMRQDGVSRYVLGVMGTAVRRVVRQVLQRGAAIEVNDVENTMSSLEKEAKEHALVKAFFASDIEAQREALAHEIEACKTMYAKRVIDGDEHARKLCLKLHELAIAEEAMEDLVYESLEKEEVVVIRYHQPSSMSQQAWEAWGDDPEDNV